MPLIEPLRRPTDGGGGNDPATGYSILNRMLADTGGAAEIYHVTNLDADGAGSFRDAIEGGSSAVTRVVVFDVSGVCNVGPLSRFSVKRGNLFVAGETAPDPGDGNGRGFHLRGASIRVQRSNVVFRHITTQPKSGEYYFSGDSDQEGIHFYAATGPNLAAYEGFLCQNCSLHGSTDEAVGAKSNDKSGFETQLLGRAGYVDCFIPSALSSAVRKVEVDGEDADETAMDGHQYGPLVGYGTFGVLFLRNLIASCVRRAPQFGGSCDGLIINNFVFGHGKPNPSGSGMGAVPFIVDARTGDSTDYFSPHTLTKTAIISNYVESGKYSDPWKVNGHVTMNDGSAATDDRWHLYDDRQNVQLSYYNQAGLGMGSYVSSFNTQLEDTVQSEWFPTPLVTQLKQTLNEPPLALPPLSILDPYGVPAAVASHAGAWPNQRHAIDRWLLDRVQDKTLGLIGRVTEPSFITTRIGAAPTLPADPWTVQANGLTALENRLNELHFAAGGYPDYAAAEWFSRA